MANEEHVALINQGEEIWNKWREDNPRIRVDLSYADLFAANLRRAILAGADLSGGLI